MRDKISEKAFRQGIVSVPVLILSYHCTAFVIFLLTMIPRDVEKHGKYDGEKPNDDSNGAENGEEILVHNLIIESLYLPISWYLK